MRKTIHFCLLLYALYLPVWAFSQNRLLVPGIVNYKKSDYAGGSRTWDIRQDSKGILYFANDEGLVTFNGVRWGLFPLPNKSILRSIYIDGDDRVFVGGQGDFGYFAPGRGNQLRYVSLKDKIPKPYSSFADVWHIAAWGRSLFFQATDRIFELSDNNIRVHPAPEFWQYIGLAGKRLLAQDRNLGLLELKNGRWVPLKTDAGLIHNMEIASIIPNGENRFLVTTIDNNAYILQNDTISKMNIPGRQELYTPSQSRISPLEFVSATMTEGCLIKDFNNHTVQRVSQREGLQNNKVSCVFVDRDKNIWAAVNNGIDFIHYNSAIKHIRINNDDELGAYATRMFNNELYIATTNGVFSATPARVTGELNLFTGDFSLIRNSDQGEARSLDVANNELLLAHNNGIYILQNHTFQPVYTGNGAWTFLPTSSIDPVQNLLVGTYTGLNLLNYNGAGFISKGALQGNHDSYRFLAMDNNGEIWASHPYRGVYRFRVSPDNKTYISRLFTNKDGLPAVINNFVFKIKNRIVFATTKGVYEFDPVKSRFIPSALLTPVFKQMELRYMNEDAEGNIWFCGPGTVGVACYSQKRNNGLPEIIFFPELTGRIMQRFENIYPYNNENIFIGAESGMIHLNFRKYVSSNPGITVLLNQVKTMGKTDSLVFGGYFHRNAQGHFQQSTNEIPKLPATFNAFHFEYSTPVFGMQTNIEYSYQLEGYDKKWADWSGKTEKDYTNLPDGEYTFKIKARDNLKHESEMVRYSFVIRPPWYKTLWAKLLYILLAGLFVYLLIKWQKRKLQQQQYKFEAEQKRLKYIHQLETEKNEKEIIKLQNEMLAQEIQLKKKELANTSMHLAGNTEILVKIKEELKKLNSNSEEDVKRITGLLKDVEKNNANWNQFAAHFDELNDGFLKKLKTRYPHLSATDLKLCAYLRLNLSSKEIAQLLNISVRGVEISRYRLRKKLGLQKEQLLGDFLNAI
ncbi:MAG: hypothetical protein J7599_10495 [Niabella sp.]|nr:hypothetical protein [Niabella sp.]